MNDLFNALSDKSRRRILEMLKNGDLTAGEIAEEFAMTKPSISHHLNILFRADLVHKQKEGQFIYYSLNTTVMQDVMSWIMDFINNEEESK